MVWNALNSYKQYIYFHNLKIIKLNFATHAISKYFCT